MLNGLDMKAGAFAHQSDMLPNMAQDEPYTAVRPSDFDTPSQDVTSPSFASAFASKAIAMAASSPQASDRAQTETSANSANIPEPLDSLSSIDFTVLTTESANADSIVTHDMMTSGLSSKAPSQAKAIITEQHNDASRLHLSHTVPATKKDVVINTDINRGESLNARTDLGRDTEHRIQTDTRTPASMGPELAQIVPKSISKPAPENKAANLPMAIRDHFTHTEQTEISRIASIESIDTTAKAETLAKRDLTSPTGDTVPPLKTITSWEHTRRASQNLGTKVTSPHVNNPIALTAEQESEKTALAQETPPRTLTETHHTAASSKTQTLSANIVFSNTVPNAAKTSEASPETLTPSDTALMSFDDIFTDEFAKGISPKISSLATPQIITEHNAANLSAIAAITITESPQTVSATANSDLGLSVSGPATTPLSSAALTPTTPPGFTSPSHPAIAAVSQGLIAAKETQQGISIRLDPPEMGRVFIDFAFEDGRVTVVIRSETAETQAFLRSRAEEFSAMLHEQGLDTEDMKFESGASAGQNGFTQNDPESHSYNVPNETDAANENMTAILPSPTNHDYATAYSGRLDMKL